MSDFIEFKSVKGDSAMSIRVSSIVAYCLDGDNATVIWMEGFAGEFIVGHTYEEVKKLLKENSDEI